VSSWHRFRCSKTNSGRVDSLREQDPDPPLTVSHPLDGLLQLPLAPNLRGQSDRSGITRFLGVVEAAFAVVERAAAASQATVHTGDFFLSYVGIITTG
jgi:hypothetical protein